MQEGKLYQSINTRRVLEEEKWMKTRFARRLEAGREKLSRRKQYD